MTSCRRPERPGGRFRAAGAPTPYAGAAFAAMHKAVRFAGRSWRGRSAEGGRAAPIRSILGNIGVDRRTMDLTHAATAASLTAEASRFTHLPLPEGGAAGALLAYWNDKRGARAMPTRGDIRPAEMRAHLPSLLLLDPIDGGADFRIRLFGSHLVDIFGVELTGRRVGALKPEVVAAKWLDLARACFGAAAPVAARTRMAAGERFHMVYEVLFLPLSPDDASVAQILGQVVFLADIPAGSERWIPAALPQVAGDGSRPPDGREKRPPLPRERRFLMRTRPG